MNYLALPIQVPALNSVDTELPPCFDKGRIPVQKDMKGGVARVSQLKE